MTRPPSDSFAGFDLAEQGEGMSALFSAKYLRASSAPSASLYSRLRQSRESYLESGGRLIDLSMINPDLPPPRLLLDKLMEASNQPRNHRYSVSRGTKRLREAFTGRFSRRFGVDLDSETEVCVTMGTKEALASALRVIAKSFAKRAQRPVALLPTPVYPAHRWAAEEAGFETRFFSVGSEESMLSEISSLLDSAPGALLITNFPHNPTGRAVSQQFWSKLLAITRPLGSVLLNDFVYGELCWSATSASPGCAVSALAAAGNEGVIETYSLSKAYSVPGWRVGAVLGDARIISAISSYKSRVDYGVFTPLQLAAAAALEASTDCIGPIAEVYRRRLDIVVKGLRQVGCDVPFPEAGLCVWAQVPDAWRVAGASAFCEALLSNAGIATLPGALFSPDGEASVDPRLGYRTLVRFALVASESDLASLPRVIVGLDPTRINA